MQGCVSEDWYWSVPAYRARNDTSRRDLLPTYEVW